MTNTQIHEAYTEIWAKYDSTYFKHLLDRGFFFQYDNDETECDLLFIGINPAFNLKEDKECRDFYPRAIGDWNDIKPYFKPFVRISDALKNTYQWEGKWTHIDLFAFRETNQKYIETDLLKPHDGIGIHFLYDQLMIAKARIRHIRPKVIVISNALVRMFTGKERITLENQKELGVWMDFQFKFDHALGTDIVSSPEELKGVPVFFTSMLSGQRALDNGSKERLTWHIAKALGLSNNLPSFFNYSQEDTDNGYESIQDFFISWAIRCAQEKYQSTDSLLHEYSQRILHALLFAQNDGDHFHIPPFENRTYTVVAVKTWRQWRYIDLLAEVTLKYGEEEKTYVLNIENKWYSPLKEHQLQNANTAVLGYYENKDPDQIRNIVLFCDDLKMDDSFDLGIRNGFQFLSVDWLLHHKNDSFVHMPTGNDVFDTYWKRKWG